MSSDETLQDAATAAAESGQTETAATTASMNTDTNRKRPRLVLTGEGNGRERKRGKSMFGVVLGTLNKARIEDKERSASEAAKKRQMIEQRLQHKLKKETDSVRRAEEAKKDKTTANRKEEDLQLKDSIYKLRRIRLPLLSNFLLTSDVISDTDDSENPSSSSQEANPLANPPRSHPPPLYYLPAILTPAQEAFLAKRKQEVTEAAEREWELFREERTTGIAEIDQFRQRVAEEEEARKKGVDATEDAEMGTDQAPPPESLNNRGESSDKPPQPEPESESMDVDDQPKNEEAPKDKEESVPPPVASAQMQADDDDAVEY